MLKGHVFNQQLFGNEIFALFINSFLAGHNGVLQDYAEGMNLSYNNFDVTISSGACCIQGRFLEEDTSTTITASESTAFARLILEIDLDQTNTELEFNQAKFKIITDSNNYPTLIQTDIVNNNSGIYQYSLAKFQTSSNGISNFIDERTFLDFDSIYEEIEQHIQEIDSGSIYALKEDVEEEFNNLITVPIGSGIDFYGQTAPDKFLFADGSAISRTEYSELFAVIGTIYGAGDGNTTFNLPDKRERVTVGYKVGSLNGTSGATMGILGAKGGEFKHALTSSENAAHTHNVTYISGSGAATSPSSPGRTVFGSDGAQTIATGSSGSGSAHNNLQPYLVCNYIIRVK